MARRSVVTRTLLGLAMLAALWACQLLPVETVAAPETPSNPDAVTLDRDSELYGGNEAYARSSRNGLGAVATVHPLATAAGLEVLDSGGNALDAAVAAALALGVVDSHNSGIGGGCFAVVHLAATADQPARLLALDGREMAPAKAHRDMYLREGVADSRLSRSGALASGIPGSLAVYDYLLTTAGRKSLAELIGPIADLAEGGFPLSQVSHDRLVMIAPYLDPYPETRRLLLDPQGTPWPVGHQFRQPELANTYRAIAEQGIGYFYGGEFARQTEAWMQANGGIITAADFANYRLLQRQPVVSRYRGYEIYGFPPPSSGGVHVAQMLTMLEGFKVAEMAEADRYHLLAEVMKRAFADRAHFLGDPDFVPVPKGLIDVDYARQRAASIDLERASAGVQHGAPPRLESAIFGKHTTHISAADRYGNWVAITTTINTSFGSRVMIPGTGVLLNNQMDDFAIQPKTPNAFGLVGDQANRIEPGKRPLSSMSPTLVLKDGQPVMALGAAGGPMIINQVVQALVNVIDLNMPMPQALAASRIHHQWQPDVVIMEDSLPAAIRAELTQRGHQLQVRSFAGSSQGIRLTGNGEFDAAAEPRIIARNRQPWAADDKKSAAH